VLNIIVPSYCSNRAPTKSIEERRKQIFNENENDRLLPGIRGGAFPVNGGSTMARAMCKCFTSFLFLVTSLWLLFSTLSWRYSSKYSIAHIVTGFSLSESWFGFSIRTSCWIFVMGIVIKVSYRNSLRDYWRVWTIWNGFENSPNRISLHDSLEISITSEQYFISNKLGFIMPVIARRYLRNDVENPRTSQRSLGLKQLMPESARLAERSPHFRDKLYLVSFDSNWRRPNNPKLREPETESNSANVKVIHILENEN
jgi:hypothetical protein